MPIVLKESGFVIYIFGDDHLPKHVHIYRGRFGGPLLIVNLLDFYVRTNRMKANDACRALRLVEANHDFLIGEWDRIVGDREGGKHHEKR